jgi:hypothetical protein
LRSIYVPKSKRLLLSIDIDEQQKAFILAKEIAYNYLEITERLYFSWIKFDNFDQVLNNFYASAGAANSRKQLVSELNLFLIKTDPKPQEMIELMGKFNVSGIILPTFN